MTGFLTDTSATLQTLIDKGGPTMIALGILSVAVVAVFIARALALALSGAMSSALATAARNAAGQPDGPARASLEAAAAAEASRLRAGFRFMDLAVTAAPLLGLLGTVFGMIEAFRALEQAGSQVDPALWSGGIWEALLTTAAGLSVAIPALAAFHWFDRTLERLRFLLEDRLARLARLR